MNINSAFIVKAISALAFARAGDTARAAYKEFFALWKDADPDIPILKDAKTEYAKLKWAHRARACGTRRSPERIDFSGDRGDSPPLLIHLRGDR